MTTPPAIPAFLAMSAPAFLTPALPLSGPKVLPRLSSSARLHRLRLCPRRPTSRRLHPLCAASQPNDPSPSAASAPTIAFSTAASSGTLLGEALMEATSRALANLSPGGPPTLAIVFVSAFYTVSNIGPTARDSMHLVVPKLRALVPQLAAVIGCTAAGVIGHGSTGDIAEVEGVPGVSVTLARLPGIHVKTFHVMPDDIPSSDASQHEWQSLVGNPHVSNPAYPPAFMILSDTGFAEKGELDRFLSGLEFAYPGSSVVGSLASTAAGIAQGHLYCTLPRDVLSADSTSMRDSGLVGISLTGDVQLDCLVSSGCRPIGPVFEVRKVTDGNVIMEMELVGRPSTSLSAVGHLKSVISYATAEERRLMQHELLVGIAVDSIGGAGGGSEDYLTRHVVGTDMVAGGITITTRIRPGQRIRFYIKEMEAAQRALDTTMQKYKRVELANSLVGYSNPPFGAMVFVDSGRGRSLFREPLMETRNITSFAPGVPVAGFFGGGQVGPCKSGEDGFHTPSVLHIGANLIALVRRRSGMTPADPVDSSTTSSSDLGDDNSKE